MRPSLADNGNVNIGGHIMERNASALRTEFEFDSCSFSELNDEPPLSPKLLYSPNYSPNYNSPDQFSAEGGIHASKTDNVELQVFDDHLPSVLMIHHERPNDKKRVSLRSLLNRRDLEHLSPLTNLYNIKSNHQITKKDVNKQVPIKTRGSPALTASPSSSPIDYHVNQSSNDPCKFEDNQRDASATESISCQAKRRKWAFKLDLLRKGPSPRSAQALHDQGINDKNCLNRGIISNQPDHCGIAAAAQEARFDDYLHERDNAVRAARIDHYRAAAAAGEARFNAQINQSIHNYRVAAGVITKFESPRQSTSSVISSVSSSPRRADNEMIRANQRRLSKSAPVSPADNEMIRANHRKISKSAPISPAASPRRSLHAGEGAFTGGRPPMSPHALHYEQQRARNEELRRKTFLPYRQSLLSACFLPLSRHHHLPQAVC